MSCFIQGTTSSRVNQRVPVLILTIEAMTECNNTQVQCVAHYLEDNIIRPLDESCTATLRVQGMIIIM